MHTALIGGMVGARVFGLVSAVSEHNKDEPAGQSNAAYMPKEAVIAKEGND